MERIAFRCAAVAMMGLGVCTIVWPAWIVWQSRDEGDDRPLNLGVIWATRVAGVGIVVGGGYVLHALLTGMPGADFLTP